MVFMNWHSCKALLYGRNFVALLNSSMSVDDPFPTSVRSNSYDFNMYTKQWAIVCDSKIALADFQHMDYLHLHSNRWNVKDYSRKYKCFVKHSFTEGGGHTPLCFVTTCDNGVLNGGGIYALLNKFSRLICIYKATLTYFLAPYIYL
jgi:hypothetical protein